ncbi:unnamed protein product [Rhizoctonia solani]|uniref:Uncharacterized protein n=1 Tax=Rhizoctonia solani TaxID=456999 RepID=A0A8H3DLY9_9AGAM|nr:unnamed protein product [Rhizoctonia solani]
MSQSKMAEKNDLQPVKSDSTTRHRFTWEEIEHRRYGIGYDYDKHWDGKSSVTTDSLMLRMSMNTSPHVIKFIRPRILPRLEVSLFVSMA